MAKRPNIHTARFELRCSVEELAAWRRAAAECGLSLSQYIRQAVSRCDLKLPKITQDYPKLPKTTQNYLELPNFTENYRKQVRSQTDPALLRQIAAVGNNLNQIAFWCNTYKSQQETDVIEKEIIKIRESLEKLLTSGVSCVDKSLSAWQR